MGNQRVCSMAYKEKEEEERVYISLETDCYGNKTDRRKYGSRVKRIFQRFSVRPKTCNDVSLRQISSFIGVFLMFMPLGIPWYWGNIVVYTDSYLRARFGPGRDHGSTWIPSLFLIMWPAGMPIAKKLTIWLGPRKSKLCVVLIFDCAMLLSYKAVQTSLVALVFTLGVVAGTVSGCMYGQMMPVIISWTSKNTGLVTAILTSGFTAGSILVNQLVTYSVNPNNHVPDLMDGPKKYFTQEEILDNVPFLFVILCGYCFFFHIIAWCLVCEKDESEKTKSLAENEEENKEREPMLKQTEDDDVGDQEFIYCEDLNGMTEPNEHCHTTNFSMDQDGTMQSSNSNPDEKFIMPMQCDVEGASLDHKPDTDAQKSTILTESAATKMTEAAPLATKITRKTKPVSIETERSSIYRELSPWQMLHTLSFYLMWQAVFCCDLCYFVLINYYKAFGQLYIHDDHFMANISFLISFSVIAFKPAWGIIIDRKGIKFSIVCVIGAMCQALCFWYFTPRFNRWLFALYSAIFAGIICSLYVLALTGTLQLFGKKHYVTNISLMLTSGALANTTAPTILEFILHSYGWFTLFYSVAVLNALSLLIVVIKFPDT